MLAPKLFRSWPRAGVSLAHVSLAQSTRRFYQPNFALVSRLDMLSSVERAIVEKPVVLFMKGTPELPMCGYSRAMIKVLNLSGVDPAKFASYDVLDNAELRQTVKNFSDWPTFPQLYVGRDFIGGIDITLSLFQLGKLNEILEAAGALPKNSADESAKGKQTQPPPSQETDAIVS